MQVTMKISMAGPNHEWLPGKTYEIEDAEARRLIDAGYAVPESGETAARLGATPAAGTLRVKMQVSMAGPNHEWIPGQDYDIEEEEALRLIKAGYAVPAPGEVVERAVAAKGEKRAKRGKRGK